MFTPFVNIARQFNCIPQFTLACAIGTKRRVTLITNHYNQDFHFGPGAVTVCTRAATKSSRFRAEPRTSPPPAGPKARPSGASFINCC